MRMRPTTTEHYAACKSGYQGESNHNTEDALAIDKSTHKKPSPKSFVSPASYAFVVCLRSSKCSHSLLSHSKTRHQEKFQIEKATQIQKIYRQTLRRGMR